MAFPLTHLCVACEILKKGHICEKENAPQFLLGSISPDAVHYRAQFQGANMSNIGPAKKITHLCPVSDERWGQVTDNDGWVKCVQDFLRKHPNDAFAAGYAVHALTDIYNNITLWSSFRTNHPEEAAKGYASEYYTDLRNITTRMYQEHPAVAEIFALLAQAEPAEMPGLVSADETAAIRQSLFEERRANTDVSPAPKKYSFVTWRNTTDFIRNAAIFCAKQLLP